MWETIKWTNISIVGVSEGEEREKSSKRAYEEIKAENSQIWYKT